LEELIATDANGFGIQSYISKFAKRELGQGRKGTGRSCIEKKKKVRASPLKGTDENKGVSSYEAMKK